MAKWRQCFHRAACGFVCLLFGGMGFLSLRILPTPPDKPPRILSILFVVFAAVAITGMFRYLRTIISEFRYDGSKLRFRTVGNREPQTLHLTDIVSLREWKGRGGPVGYRLQSRDGNKLYLEHSVSNSITLVNLMRTHMYDGTEG
jgi:hypothetical protein